MLGKLSDGLKSRLAEYCEQINNIFTEEENGFTENTIDEYYQSTLYKGISRTMNDLGKWC